MPNAGGPEDCYPGDWAARIPRDVPPVSLMRRDSSRSFTVAGPSGSSNRSGGPDRTPNRKPCGGRNRRTKTLALVSLFHPAAYTVPGNPRRVGSRSTSSAGWPPVRPDLWVRRKKHLAVDAGTTHRGEPWSRRREPSTRGVSPPLSPGLPGCSQGHTGRRKGRSYAWWITTAF